MTFRNATMDDFDIAFDFIPPYKRELGAEKLSERHAVDLGL